MTLRHFGFIVVGDDFVQEQGTDKFKMKVVGVSKPKLAIDVAKSMVAEGIQAIELCGAFSPVVVGKIIEAIEFKVPVGTVSYGAESVPGLYKLFTE